MKNILLLLLLLVLPVQSEIKNSDNTLTVVTYNIHHGRGLDDKIDIERIAEVIRKSEADIVALQEVDIYTRRSGNIDILAKLSDLTNLPYTAFGKNLDHEGGEYGNAILSKYPIKKYKNYHFQKISNEQRGVLAAIISVDQTDILFMNTHLDHTSNDDSERTLYMNKITNEIIPAYKKTKAILLAGDLNDVPGSKTYKIASQTLKDAWIECGEGDGYTIPVRNSNRRIDYIFYSGDIEPVKSKVIYSEASDHLPVMVHFMFGND